MATYQITTPDGAVYEVTQPDPAPAVDPAALNYDIPQGALPQASPMTPEAPPGMAQTKFAEPAERQLTVPEALSYGSQAALRGAADLAGAPVDVPIGLLNLGGLAANTVAEGGNWALDTLFGTESEPARIPSIDFSLSDVIADTASDVATWAGVPPTAPEDMGGMESLYDPIRYATGAAGAGSILSGLSKAAKLRLDETGQRGPFDGLLRPYMDRPAAAVSRDATAGGGAAVVHDLVGDDAHPFVQFLAALGGGMGGETLLASLQGLPRGIGNAADKLRSADQIVPVDPDTRVPFNQGQANLAAAEFQRRAGDRLPAARETVDENFAELQQMGVPQEATPTFGLLTEDPGLIQLERGFRTDLPDQFIERDQNVKNFAAGQVEGLRNPNADMKAVGASIDATERSYEMTRDAEALPLLRAAEQSGVAADPAPVAALIDQKLLTAKRPPVRKALAEARAFLNTVGSEDLDTSVSGLYEARKAINDVIEGRGENATGRFASKELIEVRTALDKAITSAAPEFGQYLQKYREGSEPLDALDTPIVEAARGPTNARSVARKILANDIDGADQVREIQSLISGDPSAEEAFRAAFAEEIARKITTGVEAGDEGYEVSLASISKEFKQKQEVLAAAFPPEDMQTLQQVNTLLGHFRGLGKKATPGSDTASLLKAPDIFGDAAGPLGKSVQIAVRHVYGDLKGGGILRRFKLMQAVLPSARDGANQIAYMAQFNPELGRYLLGLPVKNIKRIPTNWGLRAAVAADLAAQGEPEVETPSIVGGQGDEDLDGGVEDDSLDPFPIKVHEILPRLDQENQGAGRKPPQVTTGGGFKGTWTGRYPFQRDAVRAAELLKREYTQIARSPGEVVSLRDVTKHMRRTLKLSEDEVSRVLFDLNRNPGLLQSMGIRFSSGSAVHRTAAAKNKFVEPGTKTVLFDMTVD